MPRVKLTEICAGRIGGRRRTTPIARSGFERGSKSLVGLDAQSATQTAQSLANAIGQLATDNPASGFNPDTGTGWSTANPFWTALAEKAQQSADYIATTKLAQRYYYGSSPWSETIVRGTNRSRMTATAIV